jgi:hypothetical protein
MPDKASGGRKGAMRLTGAVNMIEREEVPWSPSPQWSLSFRRKCRARNLIGCDGNHVMLQCDKLLSLGLAERRDALEKSGLCMFCLKHSADLECYGKGGLSKPRCTHPGCDGEHTPGVHMLMGENNAGVNLLAGGEDENEAGERPRASAGTSGSMRTEVGGSGQSAWWRHWGRPRKPHAPPPAWDQLKAAPRTQGRTTAKSDGSITFR